MESLIADFSETKEMDRSLLIEKGFIGDHNKEYW